jgi:hypothetical protein
MSRVPAAPQRLCTDNAADGSEHFSARSCEHAQGFGESSRVRLLAEVLSSPDMPPEALWREYLRNFGFTLNSAKGLWRVNDDLFEFVVANTVFAGLFS